MKTKIYTISFIALSGLFLYLLVAYWDKPLILSKGTRGTSKSTPSTTDKEIASQVRSQMDSMQSSVEKSVAFDTIYDDPCPILIVSSRLTRSDYSSRRGIAFTYQNISQKKISAARFKWYGEDAFGEPADMGSYVFSGFGAGFDDDPIEPKQKRSVNYDIFSKDAKKIVKIWVTEVVYSDGIKWKSRSIE